MQLTVFKLFISCRQRICPVKWKGYSSLAHKWPNLFYLPYWEYLPSYWSSANYGKSTPTVSQRYARREKVTESRTWKKLRLVRLVERCTGIAELIGSNPVRAWIFSVISGWSLSQFLSQKARDFITFQETLGTTRFWDYGGQMQVVTEDSRLQVNRFETSLILKSLRFNQSFSIFYIANRYVCLEHA